jgi:hypothetical protein
VFNLYRPNQSTGSSRPQAYDLCSYLKNHKPKDSPVTVLILAGTPKNEGEQLISDFEGGVVDTLIQGGVLIEGWNSLRCKPQEPFASALIALCGGIKEMHPPNWQAIHHHPQMGAMSADLMLADWLAHDLFHIRQVTDLYFAHLTERVKPLSLAYSGWE